ncbi:MAG: vitamin K epoxide reductase family protein [Candidatus Pacearchaeota archaeon]
MKIKTKQKYIILLILTIISLISSLVLSFPQEPSGTCIIGGGCDVVHTSKYNYTFGIQNSYLGIVIFLALSLLIYLQMKKPTKDKRDIIHLTIIVGSVIALYFLYIQHFVLNSYCEYCIVTDVSLLISLGIIIWKWEE